MISFSYQIFGYPIEVWAQKLDDGWDVGLFGGSHTHVGAVTFAEPDGTEQTMMRLAHKEAQVTRQWALHLARLTGKSVCVRSGIHYDDLSQTRLKRVIAACDEMLAGLSEAIQREEKF